MKLSLRIVRTTEVPEQRVVYRRGAILRVLFAIWLATLSWQALCFAGESVSVSDFQRTTFTAKDGVPEKIWAISQTGDGWLWFGGPTGLARFDGFEFERFDVSTSDGRLSAGVSAAYALHSGGLVIGHLSGGVSIFQKGLLTRFDSEELRAAGRPFDFVETVGGVIWGAFENGMMRFETGRWTRVDSNWNLPSGSVRELHVDAGGTMWVHTLNQISRLAPGARRFEPIYNVAEPGMVVQLPNGEFRFMSEAPVPELRWMGNGKDAGASSRTSNSLYIDSHGNIWANIWALKSQDAIVQGLDQFGLITTALEDNQGNVWISELGALHRLRRPSATPIFVDDLKGRSSTGYRNLTSDSEGKIWFTQLLLSDLIAGRPFPLWTVNDDGKPVKANGIESAYLAVTDMNGGLWAIGPGAFWERRGAHFIKLPPFPTAETDPAIVMTASCVGGLWAAFKGPSSNGRLLRFDETAWREPFGDLSLPPGIPTSLHCDRAHNLWLGYADGRVARVDEMHKTTLYPFVGPGVGTISSISVGRSTLVGGSNGLAILGANGFVRLASRLPVLEGITGIAEASDGYVWLNGARGLVRVWTSDMTSSTLSNPEIRTELFDTQDGFPSPTYSLANPVAPIAIDRNHRVWFSGLRGLAVLNADKTPPASQSVRIELKGLIAGGKTFETSGIVSLPIGTRSVDVLYTALGTHHADRVQFRYRLDEVDGGWVNAETRRRAIYTNLPPGIHLFQVDASNELGTWTNQPTTLSFEIPPTFIQSNTFKFLCAAAVLFLLVTAYLLRIRYLEQRHRQLLVERLDERERIARDLHDTLLQGTQALILVVHSATKLAGNDDPIRQVLDRAVDQAHGVMVEARNRIEDLRVHSDLGGVDLPTMLVRFGQESAQGEGPRFEATVKGQTREINPTAFREAGLIGREALSNAFQHAKATIVELQIEFSDKHFRMRIHDDGVGFDDKALSRPPGGRHWGLPGMQERARSISAEIRIWSRIGVGTEVELCVPDRVAYQHAAPVHPWWRGRGASHSRT